MSRKTFTSNGITVEFEDNVPEVMEALQNAVQRGLEAVGLRAEEYAKALAPRDTGNLQDSISSEVEDDSVYIGVTAQAPYARYVEFGTGIYGENGGRQTPWSYQDSNGQWHYTHGQPAQPFLRPAAGDHASEYLEILKESLENA